MTLTLIFCGLAVGNVISRGFVSHDFRGAVEASYFQGTALFAVFLMNHLIGATQ